MTDDPLYPEFERLNALYGVGSQRPRDNFKATVDLDTQIIQYGEEVIEYNETEDVIVLLNNPTELMDETLVRMIRLAKQ